MRCGPLPFNILSSELRRALCRRDLVRLVRSSPTRVLLASAILQWPLSVGPLVAGAAHPQGQSLFDPLFTDAAAHISCGHSCILRPLIPTQVCYGRSLSRRRLRLGAFCPLAQRALASDWCHLLSAVQPFQISALSVLMRPSTQEHELFSDRCVLRMMGRGYSSGGTSPR